MVYEGLITNQYTDLGLGILIMAFAIFIICGIMTIFEKRKTKSYREELSDLYVAGKIRQLAEEAKINLEEEYELFKRWRRLRRSEDRELDRVIEEDLKEKLTEQKKEKKA